jgi:hypothetical protein
MIFYTSEYGTLDQSNKRKLKLILAIVVASVIAKILIFYMISK